MTLFRNIHGTPLRKSLIHYNDDSVQILFTCEKRAGEIPNGELADLLEGLDLAEDNTFWDVKKKIWEVLHIVNPPVLIQIERDKIINKNINNAGWISILRNTEGKLLLNALNLPLDSSNKEVSKALLRYIRSI